MPFDIWLRRANFKSENASLIWRSLLSTMYSILPGLVWIVGHGNLIYIGMDLISGIPNSSLSQPLLDKLHEKSMFFLKHIYVPKFVSSPQWRSLSELGILGSLVTECDFYVKILYKTGITLKSNTNCIYGRLIVKLEW